MTILRNGVWLIFSAWLFCFQGQAHAQTNVYTMPAGEVRGARATAFILNGTLSNIYVDDGGAGYTSPPNVAIVLASGSGSGAVVAATVVNGSVTGLTIQNPGSYSSPASCRVIIDLPPNPLQNAIKSNLYNTIILPAGSFDLATVVSNNVTIRGQGMNLTTISGARLASVFRVTPGKTVAFENLTITRGSSTNGGGIYNDAGLVTVTGCRITDNEATGSAGEGGGIYNRGSAFLIISNSVVSNNTSRRNGGGIANSGLNTAVLPPLAGSVENLPDTLRGFYSDLENNVRYGINYTTDYFGNVVANPPDFSRIIRSALSSLSSPDFNNLGKIDDKLQEYLGKSQSDATSPLDDSVGSVVQANGPGTITNAMSDPYGSGVGGGPTGWVDLGAPVLFILNSTISDNRVTAPFSGFGGGIHNDLGLVFVDNSTIENNLADSNLGTFGGGINSIFGAVRVQNSRLNNNTARSKSIFAAGGAVLSFAGFLDVHDSEFRHNQVEAKFLSSGGAIKHTAGAQGLIEGSSIVGNRSGGGGGIANDYLAGLTIDRTTIESNSVSGIIGANGGGIRNDFGGELEISNSTFSFNVATDRSKGGGLYNHAEEKFELGGQSLIGESKVSLVNCTFSSNRVDGTYLKIPDPGSLAYCLLAQQYPPYTPCDFNSVATIDIPLTARGGGIYNGAEGGGEAEVTLAGCTIYGNVASGPLYVAGGFYLTGAAGLNPTNFGLALLDIGNSIVALNTGLDFSKDTLPTPASAHSQGGNLDSDGTLSSAVLGIGITTANPSLGPLRRNGGPTRTHALLIGSPAINAGDSGDCTATDQRGVARSMGGVCDIGAVEKVNPFGFADSYVALQEQPLMVDAISGVMSNDFPDAATVQLVSNVGNGALSLSPDGSFTHTGNTNFFGTNTFTYRLVDGAIQSPPIQVTIVVRPVLKIVSTSPITNRVDAPLNGDVAIAFNHALNAGTVPGSIKVRGLQSRVPDPVTVAGGAMVTVNPPVDFRPGEGVSVSALKSLRAGNGAELLKPALWQFTANVLRGDGMFKPGAMFGSYGSEGAAIGDFDGDGDLDIFVARKGFGDQVWRNDGNGVFTMAQSFRDNSSGAAVGDLDGDGDLDVVVSKRGGFDEVVPSVMTEYHCVLRNNGSGFFTETGQKIIPETFRDSLTATPEPFRYTALKGAMAVKLADLNGDGHLDILFLAGLTESFYTYRTPGNCVWLNNGSGYFEPAGQVFGDTLAYDAALGDLDGDGDIDAFIANSYTSGVGAASQVWLNDGGGRFTRGYQTEWFWGKAVALGDLDGDGDLDGVVCGGMVDQGVGVVNKTRVFINDGFANFTPGQFAGDFGSESIAITDINADGRLDLVIHHGVDTRPWTNNGSGTFTWNGTVIASHRATDICAGDFDGDGDVDVLLANARQYYDGSTPNEGIQNQVWYNNNFPVATNDAYVVAEDGLLTAPSVLGNDFDADGDSLAAETTTTIVHRGTLGQLIAQFGPANNYGYEGTYPGGSYVYVQTVPRFATNGTLNFQANGTFTYRPNSNFFGTDIIQYAVTDGHLRRTGTVSITVTPVNDAPLARDDYYTISGPSLVVNAAGGVLANDSDVEGTALSASVVNFPAHGLLTLNADGSFSYTRNVGWTGTDSFIYRASDGLTNATARVKIGNAAPVAASDNYALPGNALSINAANGVLINDTDPDGDTGFTAVLATPPSFGTLQLNSNGSFTYHRATNHSGNDSFTYFASDGFDLSQPARVKLGNAAPLAVANSYNAFSGTPLVVPVPQGVLVNDSDPEGGDTLAAVLVSGPTNGVLTLSSNGSFTYTANANFSGIDAFTYRVTDGLLNSSPVAVTLTVNGRLQIVAVTPTLNAINVATNSTVEITFNVPPSVASVTSSRILIHGSLSGYHAWSPSVSSNKLILAVTTPFRVGESVRVALQPGIRGTGLFELETPYAWNFSVGSPRGGLNFTEITPSPTNHTNIRVALGDVNGDGRLDALTVGGFDAPAVLYQNNGGGSFAERLVGGEHYRQVAFGDLDRDGDTDAFMIGIYRERWLNDGAGNFTITQLASVNPLITCMTLADLDRDGDLDVFLAAVDYSIPAGQGIVWSLLNDGSGSFAEGSQTFIVNSVGNAAVADLDSDGDVDAYLVGQNGDVVLFNNGSGVFTAGTQTIDKSFNQDVDLNDLDGDGDIDAFVVTGDGNRTGRIYYNEGSGRFLPSGLSPEPRRLSTALALGDVNGDGLLDGVEAVQPDSISLAPGTNSVWLNTGTQFTNRTFAVTAGDSQHVALGDLDNDGDLDAFFANGQGTPTLNRIWINQSAPQALDDFYAANGGSPVVVSAPGVLTNDKVGDAGPITAILDVVPTRGSVTLNANGSFTYTPGGSFTGSDVFTYRATDGSQNSRIARVKIGNAVPSATNDGVYVAIAGTPLNVTAANGVLVNDGDPEGDPLTAILNAAPIHGSLVLKPNGSFVYTATNGYLGADSFTYRASDEVSNSALATVTLDVRSQLVLLERTPWLNELRAGAGANVVLHFNAPLNPTSVTNNIVISGSISGPIGFAVALSNNFLTLNPGTDFFPGEQITVLLADDLEGLASQRLAKPLVWQFTAEAPFGRGNFADSTSPLVHTNCSTARVMFADFNRDGYLDVLCVNNKIGPFTNRVGGSNTVWFGTAQGTLVDSGQRFLGPNVPNGYFSTTMGDIDGDGDIDLVSRLLGGRHDFWTNNGAGVFGLNNIISNAVWDGAAELADLDGDKDLDLFIAGGLDVSILTNNGAGQFNSTGQVLQPDTSIQGVALGDLDADGDIDAIVQPFFAGARILLNDGVGFFSDTGQALGLGGQRVCLGDFDGDADLDFIQSRSPSLLFMNDGQGNFTESSQVFDSFTTQEIKPADLDGDGDLDLVLQASEFLNGTNANRSKIWYNDGGGNFTATGFAFGTVQLANFGVADVNGDGALDVLINRSTFVDPLPVERWFNSIAMGLVEGGTTLSINDTETVPPFTDIVLRSPPSLSVSLQVRLDNIAKGGFTTASLSAAGFTGPIGNTYSRAAGSAATAQAALRQLVFAPTPNRRPVGQFEPTAFSIEATDGTTTRTNSATVVTSISVNTPPVANNDGGAGFATTESATFTTASVLTNDLDVDPQDMLAIQSVNTTGLPGNLNHLGNGTFQYTPGANFVSLPLGVTTNKSFQYTVSDASGALASATVTLAITGQNSAPVAANDTITVGEKANAVIITSPMLLNDYDVDAGEQQSLIVSALNTNGTFGIVSLLAGDAVSYNRNGAFGNLAPGATVNTTFGYTLRDVHNATSSATVTLTIVGTNDVPVAQDDVLTLSEFVAATNVTARLLTNDSDPDPGHAATLSVSGVDTANTLGSVILTNQAVLYSPNGQFSYLTNGQSATDSFTYFVTDANGATASAVMTVTVVGANSPPTPLPDEIVLQENAGATNVTALLLANDTDPDTNQTATLVVNGIALTNTSGSVVFTNGVVTYTPSPSLNLVAGQITNDVFLYLVRDPQGLTATNRAAVTIIGVNDAPVATNDTFQISEDGPAMNITALLLANDADPNPGDAASLVIDGVFTNGTVGLVTLTNGLIYYNPGGRFYLPPGVTNSDAFLYSVRDRFGSNSIASVSVTVIGQLSRPAIVISSIVLQTNGHVRMRHNGGDEGYTVLVSQDLVQWQVLGLSTWIGPGGLFEYLDATAPAFGQRFYRILVGVPPIVITSITVQPNGHVRLRHNGGDVGHSVQVSTNLVHWQLLGPSTLIGPGQFEYVDATAPGSGGRYYRIRSP